LKPLHETFLMLLVVVAGTVVATASHFWTPSFWTSFAMVTAPIPVGYASGRITARVMTLIGRAAGAG
jgi:LPS O-antigen subunit length determinant protein (WzzB/FepE family)